MKKFRKRRKKIRWQTLWSCNFIERHSSDTKKTKNSIISILCKIVIFILIVLIVLPIAAIVYLSFIKTSSIMQDIFPTAFTLENYLTIFEKPRALKPLLNSLQMSLMAVVLGLVFTGPSAYMIVKHKGKANIISVSP